jgi:hypothetical protein
MFDVNTKFGVAVSTITVVGLIGFLIWGLFKGVDLPLWAANNL